MTLFREISLVLMTVGFVALLIWVWSARNSQRFDALARMPLEDDVEPLQ